jgi:hypothetical protein
MDCVHLKEQPERRSTFHTNCIYCTVISQKKLFLNLSARVQIIGASVPEVTSMQVFECIGEEW